MSGHRCAPRRQFTCLGEAPAGGAFYVSREPETVKDGVGTMGARRMDSQRWLTLALWLVATILLALFASIEAWPSRFDLF